jgi:hypothetical protein
MPSGTRPARCSSGQLPARSCSHSWRSSGPPAAAAGAGPAAIAASTAPRGLSKASAAAAAAARCRCTAARRLWMHCGWRAQRMGRDKTLELGHRSCRGRRATAGPAPSPELARLATWPPAAATHLAQRRDVARVPVGGVARQRQEALVGVCDAERLRRPLVAADEAGGVQAVLGAAALEAAGGCGGWRRRREAWEGGAGAAAAARCRRTTRCCQGAPPSERCHAACSVVAACKHPQGGLCDQRAPTTPHGAASPPTSHRL